MKSKLVVLFIFWIYFIFLVQAQDIYEQGGPSPTEIVKGEGHPKIDRPLYELTRVDNIEEFAKNNLLDIVDGNVRVYLDLNNNKYILPEDFGIVEIRLEEYNSIQALVRIDKLLILAEDLDIRYIKVPGKPITQQDSFKLPSTTSELKSSKLIYHLTILGIIIILFIIYYLWRRKNK